MSSDRLLQEMDEQIARMEKLMRDFSERLSTVKGIRDRLVHGWEPALGGASEEPKSQFQRVAEFLMQKGNRPKTASAIIRGAGITRSSLSQILHRTHKDSFESVPIPGYTRKKLWCLT